MYIKQRKLLNLGGEFFGFFQVPNETEPALKLNIGSLNWMFVLDSVDTNPLVYLWLFPLWTFLMVCEIYFFFVNGCHVYYFAI